MEDIPLLAKHFIEFSVRELRCPKPRLTHAGSAKLEGYHRPGNIQELRNVIERAVIISRGRVLGFDLPAAEAAKVPARRAARAAGDTEPEFLTEAELQQRERENLLIIFDEANWKIKGADGVAELLGVKPTTLVNRMKKMSLRRPASLFADRAPNAAFFSNLGALNVWQEARFISSQSGITSITLFGVRSIGIGY